MIQPQTTRILSQERGQRGEARYSAARTAAQRRRQNSDGSSEAEGSSRSGEEAAKQWMIVVVFGLYIWCAAADPADAGVFRSKKYLKIPDNEKPVNARILGGESPSSIQCVNTAPAGEGMNNESKHKIPSTAGCNSEEEKRYPSSLKESCFMAMLPLVPCAYACSSHEKSSNQRSSEDCFCLCLPVIQWFVTLSSSVYCFQILKLLYLLEGFATPLS